MTEAMSLSNFEEIANLPKREIRAFIADLEELMRTAGSPLDIPINHHFSHKVYAREMKLPAGALIVGKIHKFENLNILSHGEVSVLSIDGVMRVKAPYTFVGSPGTKRVIYAHTDVVWTTIHGTHERCVDKIEEEFIAKSYDEVALLEVDEVIKIKE